MRKRSPLLEEQRTCREMHLLEMHRATWIRRVQEKPIKCTRHLRERLWRRWTDDQEVARRKNRVKALSEDDTRKGIDRWTVVRSHQTTERKRSWKIKGLLKDEVWIKSICGVGKGWAMPKMQQEHICVVLPALFVLLLLPTRRRRGRTSTEGMAEKGKERRREDAKKLWRSHESGNSSEESRLCRSSRRT